MLAALAGRIYDHAPQQNANPLGRLSTRMRFQGIAALAFVIGCSPGREPETPTHGPIFRYTSIGRTSPLDSILLGKPWGTAAKYGAKDGDTLFAIPFGEFSGADAIAVRRTTAGIVTGLEYAYHASRDVNAIVADYRSSLGPPTSTTVDTLSGSTRTITRWCDDSTTFAFAAVSPALKDGVAGWAVLLDRRLASAKPISPHGC